jgi:SAM-dependent methyltransferase
MTDDLSVIAIVSAYNEADVIVQVLRDLIEQGIKVYLIDDGSTDGTVAAVERFLGQGLIDIERRPPATTFAWSEILRRKEELAQQLDARWFLHSDADELRESPWSKLTLLDAIREVDRLGYSAIDFKVLNFRPTDDRFLACNDLRDSFTFYEASSLWDRVQVKCWRKTEHRVDLVSSGGHEAIFPGRQVFPIQFLLRHYPIRSSAHGERKVFHERLQRFASSERDRGWHIQYDTLSRGSVIRDPATLVAYDRVAARLDLLFGRPSTELSGDEKGDDIRRGLATDLAAAVAEIRVRLAESQRRIADLEGLVAQRDLELVRQQVQMTTQRASMTEALQQGIEDERRLRRQEADSHAIDTERARAERQAVLDSWSWRITRPVRVIGRLFRPPAAGPDSSSRITERQAVSWGDLDRSSPVSQVWGLDRGKPVDRYYIEQFLDVHGSDIRGRVLEIKDSGYTRLFGTTAVTDSQVLDIDATNAHATIVADLSKAVDVASEQFDCVILTQTLHIIYDLRGALGHAKRILKSGGVLLCTVPAVSRVNYEDGGLESGDYWRLTRSAVVRLFSELFAAGDVEVTTFGNVRTSTAFLYGLAIEDLGGRDLAFHDPWFPLVHGIRAVKRS